MSEELEIGCARPTGGPVRETVEQKEPEKGKLLKEEPKMIKVFQYLRNSSISLAYIALFFSAKLSEYLGKWVVLCFYPGDFTFV